MSPTLRPTILALVLLTAGLAGCIGSDDDPGDAGESPDDPSLPDPPFESFQAAVDAPGRTFEPEQDGSDVRLKLLEPASIGGLDAGTQNVTVLLYDGANDRPIEDANMTIKAWMTAMGHGTTQERDPVHLAHGIYAGQTLWSMDGIWLLNLDAVLADGDTVNFDVKVVVGQDGGPDPNAEPVHHRYEDSYEDTVTDLEYADEWTFTVKAEGAHVWVNITLNDTTAVDELTFTVLDAAENEIGSKTLSEDTPSATIEAPSAPNEGDWTLSTTGRAIETPYAVTVVETWTTIPQLDGGEQDAGGHDHGSHEH